MPRDFMEDYVPVQERIDKFKAEYPDGSLQSEIVELTDSRVTVKAYAYRTADDPRPGIGHSSLEIPGATGFTKGSEVENAETSSWGRALAALGFEVKRGIASKEEVRNKAQQANRKPPVAPFAIAEIRDRVIDILHERHLDADALQPYADKVGIVKGERATLEQWQQILALIERPASEPAAAEGTDGVVPTSVAVPSPSIEAGQGGVETPPVSSSGSPDPASSPEDDTDLLDAEALLQAALAATGGTVLPATAASAIERANKRAAAVKPERKPVNDPTQETLEIGA
jgi:hypothetical protein